MLTFLDHKGNEIGALTTFKYTNSVNGERSLSGTVHGNLEIEKGWGVRFEDEYYKVIYAKPKSLGKLNIVQFDAVHQFFWDFDKSSVYSELDGSYPFQTFLDHIFNGSGYRYNLEVEVGSLRKQNFGLKKRLELFNDLIKHAGVEFHVRGKVVRILERTGTDLSTVVRKKLNLNDLSIEKRIGDFITYQKGLGAWHDENDHSKGRLEVEYVSPLAAIYGRLEGEPYVDERFSIAENFLEVLKKSVEDSYSISVQLTMEDLHKAGYQYTRPLAGDYITVIDEDINFKERVRIVSFESEYDIKGQVIDHTVTCNDIGSVKKQSVGYSSLKSSVANVSKETESAIQTANKALVSADGKSTVYFGTEFPQDVPKGTLTKGDTLYLKVGDKTKMYYWNGAEWLEPPVVNDVEAFKESINTEIAQVNQSMQSQADEHDRQVAGILSKTQSVEALANRAKSDAASAIARANQVKTEAIADARAQIATVSQALNTAKSELQTAIASADQKARDSQASATALRNDLNLQAAKILEQAQAQTALTNRVTTVETLADGTKTTVAELSRTVNKTTGDIASVSSRTKTVEDTLSQTRTQYDALTQTVNAQTGQIDSINRKTADLQSGIDGVTERFENLQVGGENLLLNAGFEGATNSTASFTVGGVTYIAKRIPNWHDLYNSGVANPTTSYHAIYRESFEGKGPVIEFNESDGSRNWKAISAILDTKSLTVGGNYMFSADIYSTGTGTKVWFGFYSYNKNGVRNFHSGQATINISTINKWHRVAGQIKLNEDIDLSRGTNFYIYAFNFTTNSILYLTKPKLEIGTVATAFSLAQETIRSEIATYKRTAEESSAELSRQIQLVDGKAVGAKTYAQQTADAIKTRLESLEIYKNAEGARAEQYLTASREETARQLTAERTAIATNYVAKSTYDENVRGTTLKLNDIKTTADTAKQNLATYQNTVDRKLTELTSTTQTLDGKINTASAKITQNANEISKRLTSTQVDKAITDKGYQTKSDVDNNITGRSYITSSALQPYALSTTVQNLVQETAGSFERQITETRGLIPTEVNQNLFDVVFSDLRATGGASFVQSDDGWIEVTIKNRWSGFYWLYSDNIKPSEKQYVLSYEAYLVDTVANTAYLETDFGSPDQSLLIDKTPKRYTVVLNRPANIYNYINFVCNSSETGKKFRIRNIKLEEGIVATPYIAPFPTTVLFNTVKDTVDAHKRLIGNGDSISQAIQSANKFERSISSGGDIYQAIETAKGLVTEVSGTNGLKTQVSQLNNSYAIKNLTSAGNVLGQINLNPDGSVRINEGLISIGTKTYIKDGVIASAKIANLDAGKITSGYLDAARIRAGAIDGSKIAFDEAFFNGLTANQAYLKKLFAKDAFLTAVQAVSISASQISGGILTATNRAMQVNLNAGQIMYYTGQAALKRVLTGYPTQFVKFATGTVSGKGNAGVTVIGSNRWNSESSNDGGFVGIRAWNGANIDSLDLVGDEIRLASSAFDNPDGWDVKTLDSGLRIAPHNRAAERNSRIEVGDVWLMKGNGTYSSLRDILNAFNGNFSKGPNANSYTYYPNGF
ncbi:phage tail protein [Streptococcus sp. 2022WUSS037]|uniref:phage tail protein n=1 Tax=Streptococcus sp. 2022WUSS037 TaxID=2983286 RepID=UPI00379FA754